MYIWYILTIPTLFIVIFLCNIGLFVLKIIIEQLQIFRCNGIFKFMNEAFLIKRNISARVMDFLKFGIRFLIDDRLVFISIDYLIWSNLQTARNMYLRISHEKLTTFTNPFPPPPSPGIIWNLRVIGLALFLTVVSSRSISLTNDLVSKFLAMVKRRVINSSVHLVFCFGYTSVEDSNSLETSILKWWVQTNIYIPF